MEFDLKETHGKNRQRRQKLLELSSQEENWLHAACSQATFREKEKVEDFANDLSKCTRRPSSWFSKCSHGWPNRSIDQRAEIRAQRLHGENKIRVSIENYRTSKPSKRWILWELSLRIYTSTQICNWKSTKQKFWSQAQRAKQHPRNYLDWSLHSQKRPFEPWWPHQHHQEARSDPNALGYLIQKRRFPF